MLGRMVTVLQRGTAWSNWVEITGIREPFTECKDGNVNRDCDRRTDLANTHVPRNVQKSMYERVTIVASKFTFVT